MNITGLLGETVKEQTHTKRSAWVKGLAAASLLALVGTTAMSAPALAEESHSLQNYRGLHDTRGTGVHGTQTFFAYVNEGETLSVDGGSLNGTEKDNWDINIRGAYATITDPAGNLIGEKDKLGLYDTGKATDVGALEIVAPSSGIYTVTIGASAPRYDNAMRPWTIDVSSEGEDIPGRVFVTEYHVMQPTKIYNQDLNFFSVGENGDKYGIELPDFNGWNSWIRANAFGNVDRDTCVPTYSSNLNTPSDLEADADACGGMYLLFFETPATDMPAQAPVAQNTDLATPTGEHWLLPTKPAFSTGDLTFTPTTEDTMAGELEFNIAGHDGVYDILIDTDGDGNFDGPGDRQERVSTVTSETHYTFDGLDAQGVEIPTTSPIGFRIEIRQSPEMHIVLHDIETMGGGVVLTRMDAEDTENDRIYWNDSMFAEYPTCSATPEIIDASEEGVRVEDAHKRGWVSTDSACNDINNVMTGAWGEQKSLDTWTYGKTNTSGETRFGGDGEFTLEKTATNGSEFVEGDEIEWGFEVTNTGTSNLYNVIIDDALIGLDDWVCAASVPVGATVPCDAPVGYLTTVQDAENGFVVNTATADATAGPGGSAPASQTATAEVAVSAKPVDPVVPVDPKDPKEPVTPTNPVEPTNPVTPTSPVVPTVPVVPATPNETVDALATTSSDNSAGVVAGFLGAALLGLGGLVLALRRMRSTR